MTREEQKKFKEIKKYLEETVEEFNAKVWGETYV